MKKILKMLTVRRAVAAALSLTLLMSGLTVALNMRGTKAGPGAYNVGSTYYVDDWATFIAAWNDNTNCSKIVLLNDIDQTNATELVGGTAVAAHATHRTLAIEIDGRNPVTGVRHRLHLGSVQLVLAETTAVAYESMLHVHDIILRQNTAAVDAPIELDRFAFRCGTGAQGVSNIGRWILRFGNITVPERNVANVNSSGLHHLAFAFGSAMEFYGENFFAVGEEFVHCSSVEIEDNTVLIAHKTSKSDTSMFYFYHGFNLTQGVSVDRGTGFRIGDNCTVVTYNDQGGTTYPSVYFRYSWMEIGENSTFAATMTGNAFRAQFDDTTHFTVGANSVINLTSLNTGQAAFNVLTSPGFRFETEPGAEIYIVGNNARAHQAPALTTSSDVVAMTSGTAANPVQFIIKSPKRFDIRNKQQGNNNVFYLQDVNNIIRIEDTDIDIWYTQQTANLAAFNVPYATHSDPANLYVMDAGYYQLRGVSPVYSAATSTQVSTGEADLQNMWAYRYTRISGGKDRYPEVMFELETDPLLNNPTDADKFVRARAILAWTPHDDGVDINGNVEMIPIYAPPNQVKVWLASDDGDINTSDYSSLPGAYQFLDPEDNTQKWFLPIDTNGYLLLPSDYPTSKLTEFLQAGSLLSAKALRHNGDFSKTRLGEEFTARVTDVTPPVPAAIDGYIMRDQTELSGHSGEPGAEVTVYVNGTLVPASDTVDGAGNWSITLPGTVNLVAGDVVTFYMEDSVGNKNPDPSVYPTGRTYSDALFLPASQYVVQEKPAILHVRQIVLGNQADRFFPEMGYATAYKRNASNAVLEEVNMFVSSGADEATTPYTLFSYPPMSVDNILMTVIDPQYYTYTGYRISDTENANSGQALTSGNPSVTIGAQTEKWITVYVTPRTASTSYYANDAIDNNLGEVHLPITPAMSLFADQGIGYIANKDTIRLTSQNAAQIININSQAWGDGIHGDNMNWTVTPAIWGNANANNTNTFSLTIPSGNTSGIIRIHAESVNNPNLSMDFTIQVLDLIVINTDRSVEMTPNYTMYETTPSLAPIVFNYTASKVVDWRIVSQTGVGARLSSANGDVNALTIPVNYRGTINIRVTSGTLIRNFRIVVRQ